MHHRFQGPKDWSPTGNIPWVPIWPEFVDAYLEAAIWTSSDDEDRPLDRDYGVGDFSDSAVALAIKESNEFIQKNREDLGQVGDPGQHGHDFWLTRNGHGVGFWDRGYGDVGDRLTAASKKFRERDVYAGDDGELHFG
jgi:hypothetical protein